MGDLGRKRMLRAVGFIALLGFPFVAYGDGQPGPSDREAVMAVFGMIMNSARSLMGGSPFSDTGHRLLQFLLVILISWKGIKLALETTSYNMVIAELVQIIFTFGIASFFLYPDVQAKLASGFDSLATLAASGAGESIDMSKPEGRMVQSLGQMLIAAKQLWDGVPPGSENSGLAWWGDQLTSIMGGDFIFAIANLFFRAFIALGVVCCAILYVGQLIFSQIMVNIGLVMAPLFVPWLLWESTAFLFNSWLKFMIVVGVQKIVGALLFGLTANLIQQVTTLASQAGATSQINFYLYAAAFIIVGLMAFLMMQSSSIANGLVSGSPHASFKPPQGMAPGAMMKRGGSAKPASVAASGSRAGIGAVHGFRQARASGQNAVVGALRGATAAVKSGKGVAPKSGSAGGTVKPPSTPPSKSSGGTP